MGYDLYISTTYIGGINAIGDPALRWVEGHKFSFFYQGEIREFMVKITGRRCSVKVLTLLMILTFSLLKFMIKNVLQSLQ